jgi:GT2 family glycosyltransferase
MEDKIAIIILSDDDIVLLSECLNRIKENIKVCEYKIYLGYNSNSGKEQVENLMKQTFPDNHKIIYHDKYHFSSNNNDIVFNHLENEKYILFMNNDVFIREDGCVGAMKNLLDNDDQAGTVGIRLLYGNDTIQHDGIRILFTKDMKDYAIVHNLQYIPNKTQNHNIINCYVLGNTMAFCMVKREKFDSVGGLNESYMKCFEDVEFNLKLILNGYDNITLPSNFLAYHLESYTRKRKNVDNLTDENDLKMIGDFMRNNMYENEYFKKLIEII